MLQYAQSKVKKLIHSILLLLIISSLIVLGLSGCSKSKPKQETDETSNDMTPVSSQEEKPQMDAEVVLVQEERVATIYIDPKGADYDGISLVAKAFAEDVQLVADSFPEIITDTMNLKGTVILAGSIGNNELIDNLIGEGKIDVSKIKDKWECYQIQVLDQPIDGVDQAIVVVGSDKRGTIYGIYHISELIGVSPWVYWGDVIPVKQKELTFTKAELNTTSKEPSVKYRGIFLNDEWPSLGNWTSKKFGGFNEMFYDEVFELILRLKGNYLWPAMWSSSFSEDGRSSKIANAAHADAYGVVMGASHHEPMYRQGVEWQRVYKNYGTSNVWDFASNTEAITKFWEDGLKRNKDFDNVVTLGMRGEADSALQGSDAHNIQLLKDIILTQKDLLKQYNLQDKPQVLTLYKEVEKYWYGNATTEGLRKWDVLDDVTIMLAEDNHGNLRTLPEKDERDREAGWGMYYHFDYHGGPRSYEWVNTVPIVKVWEQMSMAYDYGVKELWIVNVGDLKPMELPISYFLDLAYDFESLGTNGINKINEYTKQWVEQQYGTVVDEDTVEGIAEVLTAYTRMNSNRKPEITYSTTYSVTNYNEAQRILDEVTTLEKDAKKYYELMPEAYQDSYYQLVYYPAVASANVQKMQLYAGLNSYFYKQKSVLANTYAALVQECIDEDNLLQYNYNKKMSQGKWDGMMSSAHIGYTSWNDEGWQYPTVNYISPKKDYAMIVSVEGSDQAYLSGMAELPTYTSLGKEAYWITISNGGGTKFDYSIEVSEDWIQVDQTQGSIYSGDTIGVTVDWDRVQESSEGIITITAENDKVEVRVRAEVLDIAGLDEMTFVETHNLVSIEAEHTSDRRGQSRVEWKVINEYGRSLSSLKMYPTDISFDNPEDAPYLEYKLYIHGDGDYILTTYTAPTNNLSKSSRLRYGVAFDGETPVIADTLPEDFIAGDSNSWGNGVMAQIHITSTVHRLTKGVHTLRFYGVDAGLVLQKLVLSKGPLPFSYFGPVESHYIGKEIVQKPVICHEAEARYTLPGSILFGEDIKVDGTLYSVPAIVAAKGSYQLTLKGTATKDAVVKVMVGNMPAGSIDWKAGEPSVSTKEPFALEQRSGNLVLQVVSGEADIREVIFEIPDTSIYYPVNVMVSSAKEEAEKLFDGSKATFWNPDKGDSNPWVEFEFDRAYYFDHFIMKGILEGVGGYKVEVESPGGSWTTVYKGTGLESGKEVYMQGTSEIKGQKLRIIFTKLSGSLEISEIEFKPYINWAREDSKTVILVSRESDIDKKTIIDGDRINPGWITEGNQTVSLEFDKERTIDTVTVVGIQETVKDGKPGVIPSADMTSSFVQRQYTVYYKNDKNQWVEAADYVTAPDGKETEPSRKVINKISLEEPVNTTAVKVEIGTSYWIRLIELEASEHIKVKLK